MCSVCYFRLTNDRGIVQLQRSNTLHCISGLPGLQTSAVKRRPISNGINLVAPRRMTVVVLPHGFYLAKRTSQLLQGADNCKGKLHITATITGMRSWSDSSGIALK